MKRKIVNLFQILAITAMVFTSNSCSDLFNDPLKDKDTGEDINLLLVDLNFFDTKVTFKFEDYDTGELLTDYDISVALAGNNTDKFVSLFGEKKEEYETSSGILELYLDPAYTFTNEPIQLDVFANADPAYLSAPTSFEISSAGERTIVVKMINWDNSEKLKSALATTITVEKDNTDVTIAEKLINKTDANGYTVLKQYYYRNSDPYSGRRATYKRLYDIYMGYYEKFKSINESRANFYLSIAQSWQDKLNALPAPPSFPDVNLTATSISLDEKTLEYWGFDNNRGKQITLKGGETAFTTYKQNGLSKCTSGLTIKVTSPDVSSDDKTSSSSFNYTINYSDGTATTGAISGSFHNLKTTGNKVEPINYPTNNPQVTVTLQENSQFTFEQASQTLSSPCGEVTFVAKKKQNLVNYNFVITYTCSVAGLSYSGTGLFQNTTKGTEKETFSLSAGGFSLNLIRGDQYQLSVIIDNDAYSLNIDTNDIYGSLLDQSLDGNRVVAVSVTGNDASGYKVQIIVRITDELCNKING